MTLVTDPGRHNTVWKEWRRIARGNDTRYFLEHKEAVLESLAAPSSAPDDLLLARGLYSKDPDFWDGLIERHQGVNWYLLEDKSLDAVVSVSSSSGLCGVYPPRPSSLDVIVGHRFLTVLWNVTDPGNVGTILRANRGLTDGAVVTVSGCNPWSAKVARASAGSLLGCAVLHCREEASGYQLLSDLQDRGFALHAAFPRCGTSLDQVQWTGRDAVILGNETRGLPGNLAQQTRPFYIPTTQHVESLNVAISAALATWEWRKCNV